VKKKYLAIIAGLIFLCAVSLFIFDLIQKNKNIQSQLPYLVPGEQITYFDVLGLNAEKITAGMLNSKKIALLFIFQQPCSHCDRNLATWNRIGRILKNDVDIYGIIPAPPGQMFELKENARLSFNIYSPDDLVKFKKNFRLKTDLAQTILYVDREVDFVKFGDVNGDDYTNLLRRIKTLLKINETQKQGVRR